MNDKPILDSGTRKEFESGAVRDTPSGKGRFDLLPFLALTDLAKHYEKGSLKYEARNWEKGIDNARMFESGMRHAIEFFLGQDDEDHLIAAIWNFIGIRENLRRIELGILPPEIDNIPYILRSKKEKSVNG